MADLLPQRTQVGVANVDAVHQDDAVIAIEEARAASMMRVDLPQPFLPTRAMVSPKSTFRWTPVRMGWPGS